MNAVVKESEPTPQSNVVALYEQQPASPLDLPAEVFKAGLSRRRENRAALMAWVRDALVDGTDYGKIHVVSKSKCQAGKDCSNPEHFSKPSLFKPGAEKICGMLGVTVHYPTLKDYEQAALQSVELKSIIIRCAIMDSSGRVVADGVGARSVQQDYGDINKALKMAEKSAHIDATLRMAGLSEVFTQDLEDLKKPDEQKPEKQPERISASQHKLLEAQIRDYKLDRERVKTWSGKKWNVAHFPELSPEQFESLLLRLERWASEEYAKAAAADAATDVCPF
jgi:hypothetical protein